MAELFRRIHEHQRNHLSTDPIFREFAQEWTNFILSARSGMFDAYATSKDYPITAQDLDTSGYIERPIFEDRLVHAVSSQSDIIILGNEGSGKTTLVHYIFGHVIPIKSQRKIASVYIDTRGMDITDELLTSSLFTAIYAQLARVKLTQTLTLSDLIVNDYKQWVASHPILQPLVNPAMPLNYLASMLAFLSATRPDTILYLAIDNADALGPRPLRTLLQYIESLRDTATRLLSLAGLGSQCTLKFVFPSRTSTWLHIANTAIGYMPFQNPEAVYLDQKIHSVWELTRQFIKAKAPHNRAYQAYAKNASVSATVGEQSSYSWTENNVELLSKIIDWIRDHCPTADKIIASFGGHSLRRQKMYALKVLGNAAVVSSWANANIGLAGQHSRDLRRHRISYSHEEITTIVKEALFDAMQPFGDGMVATELLLNPFGVVTDPELRSRNPFLGIHLICLIRDRWDSHTKKPLSEIMSVDSIVNDLRAMGYADAAIGQCFESFCMSGVLRPIKSETFIIAGSRELQNVVSQYSVDKEAIDLYYRLVFRTGQETPDDPASKENAILFMNACTRANYNVGYAARFDSDVYRAYVNMVFLRDTHLGDERLTRLAQEAKCSRPIKAYVPQVFHPLKRRWHGEFVRIASSVIRHDERLELDMYQAAQSYLEKLELDARNGHMPELLIERGEER